MKDQNIHIMNQNNILQSQSVQPPKKRHVEVINGATYEVISNYVGNASILDIFKQMLKRDIERIKG